MFHPLLEKLAPQQLPPAFQRLSACDRPPLQRSPPHFLGAIAAPTRELLPTDGDLLLPLRQFFCCADGRVVDPGPTIGTTDGPRAARHAWGPPRRPELGGDVSVRALGVNDLVEAVLLDVQRRVGAVAQRTGSPRAQELVATAQTLQTNRATIHVVLVIGSNHHVTYTCLLIINVVGLGRSAIISAVVATTTTSSRTDAALVVSENVPDHGRTGAEERYGRNGSCGRNCEGSRSEGTRGSTSISSTS